MIVLNLKAKNCMSHLLLKSTFDHFSFIEGEITTFNKFTFDGFLQKEFFEEVPEQIHSEWKDLRELCFSLIKGKRTPLGFKFVLSLAPKHFEKFIETNEIEGFDASTIKGLYLNFKYNGTNLQCITGTSVSTFTLDKSIENAWDDYVKKFFSKMEIEWETN